MKDGKLLVAAGGLCSDCCGCPGSLTLRFTDITVCPDCDDFGQWDAWPSDLNDRDIIVPYTGGSPNCGYRNANSEGWEIDFDIIAAANSIEIFVYYAGTFTCEEGGHTDGQAFYYNGAVWDAPGVVNNDIVQANCCCTVYSDWSGIVGFGGSVTWSKN